MMSLKSPHLLCNHSKHMKKITSAFQNASTEEVRPPLNSAIVYPDQEVKTRNRFENSEKDNSYPLVPKNKYIKSHVSIGFSDLDSEINIDELPVQGDLPNWLAGTLIRNGPAKFDLEKQSVNHWFDGLAMLHRFSFENGKVSYVNKFIKSKSFKKSKQEGKIAYREFATDPCRSIFSKVSSMFSLHITDNANVNISKLDEKFVALTETPIPIEFDPKTLETVGLVDYRDQLEGNLTTAHPHYDNTKDETFNYLTKFSRNSKYHIYRKQTGKDRTIVASIDVKEPSYMHSFGMTQNYLILTEFPLVINPVSMLLSGKPFIENFKWKPEKGTKFTFIERSTGKVVGSYYSDPFFAFHHINAFEIGNKVIVDIVAYDDNSIINSLYLEQLRGNHTTTIPKSEYRRYTVDIPNNQVSFEVVHDRLELPRINYQFGMKNYSYLYAAGMDSVTNFTDRLIKINVQSKDFVTWSEKNCHPGEPIFVARPGSNHEDDGVILSVVLDSNKGRSFLLVLDARSFKETARALVPHHIPFGIHGQYYKSVE